MKLKNCLTFPGAILVLSGWLVTLNMANFNETLINTSLQVDDPDAKCNDGSIP